MPFPIAGAALVRPVVALNIWTFIMEFWMYKQRIPAIYKYNIKLDPTSPKSDLDTKVPPHVRWPADNYNHLMEQPTQFYAVALALAIIQPDDKINEYLAWSYVGLRVVHSVWQATGNAIFTRFQIFATSSLVLAALTGRAVMNLI